MHAHTISLFQRSFGFVFCAVHVPKRTRIQLQIQLARCRYQPGRGAGCYITLHARRNNRICSNLVLTTTRFQWRCRALDDCRPAASTRRRCDYATDPSRSPSLLDRRQHTHSSGLRIGRHRSLKRNPDNCSTSANTTRS